MTDPTFWTRNAPTSSERPRLEEDLECDVCVVGAGIAGLSTAYRLARAGKKVVVLEGEDVGSGETHHTSAHLTCAFDDRIYRVAERFGPEKAKLVVQSHAAAIDWIEETAAREEIACEFRRVPGYLFLAPGDDPELLGREHQAARDAGLDVEWLDPTPVPGMAVGPCLAFARQAEFHPMRFLSGLADAFERLGGKIYAHTHVVDIHDGTPCGVETSDGAMVAADAVLLATNSPSNTMMITMKMVPYRTFLVAMRATGPVTRALYWDTGDPYHYVRLVDDERGTLVLSGGGDYQTAVKDEGDRVFAELEEWTRARFPVAETEWRWSGQVLEPADWLGFVGRLHKHGDGHVYVCTGDSGQGLTHGAICALLVGDLIQGKAHPWEEIYSPSRITLGAAGAYVSDGVKIAINFIDWLLPGEVRSESRVPRGHGAVMRDGTKLIAVYRDQEGTVQRRSAVCTHAGCIVHWDSTARIWACPCHGSRFHPDGGVINGPATAPLAELEEASESPAAKPAAATPAPPPTLSRKPSRTRKSGTPKP
jgi:glycine/D-amino acid oxidase-like deaminating enzyme/nitrite reductase/ring-hydroxylating ferredoxin subunit